MSAMGWSFRRPVRPHDLALFVRQFSAMLAAGVPLVDALHFLAHSDHPEMNRILDAVATRVSSGHYLSASMSKHPEFPGYMVSLVRLGEATGSLVPVLEQLARYLERAVGFRRQVAAALTYPGALAVVSLALIWLLSFYLLPAMTPMFAQLQVPLPWLTRFVLAATSLWTSPTALLAGGLGVVAALLVYRQLQEAEDDSPLRRGVDRFKLTAPLLGNLIYLGTAARLLRMLS
ncbi:MAG: type II secretion system F family protein, partial [Candidatus Eremiobacterota bacterium]